jgi:hypothetical protein
MAFGDELKLLIKSKYPVVFVEAIDEQYAVNQLIPIADEMGLTYYEWSVTKGLRRKLLKDPLYNTEDAGQALRNILSIMDSPTRTGDALFVLKDFDKFLSEPVVLRLLKDLINLIKGTRTTVIIVASQYKLPPDVEACAARIVGGYPEEAEIVAGVNEILRDMEKEGQRIEVAFGEGDEERLLRALSGLSLQQVRTLMNQCLLESGRMDTGLLAALERRKKAIFDREGLLEFCVAEKADAIANFDNMKRWLADRKGSFHTRGALLPAPKGVMMIGVQGCGKSLAAKMIAGELGLGLYRMDLARFYSKYIGETEQNLTRALKTVDQLSPVCLWIDEIEKSFAASGGEIDGGVSQRLLATFLTWMQERTCACFVAATANDIYALPPEFLRKGRFDEIFFVDLPDHSVRESLFRIHLGKRKLAPRDFDCARLSELAKDFSGAEIEQAIISALYRAAGRKEPLATAHIEAEIRGTRPLAVIKREEIDALRAWSQDRTVPA